MQVGVHDELTACIWNGHHSSVEFERELMSGGLHVFAE